MERSLMDPGKDGGSEAPYKNDRATIRSRLIICAFFVPGCQRTSHTIHHFDFYEYIVGKAFAGLSLTAIKKGHI